MGRTRLGLRALAVSLSLFLSLPAGIASQGAPSTAMNAQEVLNWLRSRLQRVALARQKDERVDVSEAEPTLVNVTVLVGIPRQRLLDVLGPPSFSCKPAISSRSTKPAPPPAPCRGDDDLAYSFYALPKNWRGGGPELLFEFDGGQSVVRARWFRTQ